MVGVVHHVGLLGHGGDQGGQVQVRKGDLLGLVVPPDQKQQLLHQVGHGVGLLANGVDGLLPNLGVVLAPPVQQVGVALNDGNRGAQLVAGVGGEAHLGLIAPVNALQHGVDGLPQGRNLLAAPGDRHPLGHGALVHPFQLPGQPPQLVGVQGGVLQGLRRLRQGPQGGQGFPDRLVAAPDVVDQKQGLHPGEHRPLPELAVKAEHHHDVHRQKAQQRPEENPGHIGARGGGGILGQWELSG